MKIRFIRSPAGLGYMYRAGDGAGNLPDHIAQMLIKEGYAIEDEERERQPRVLTTQVTRSRKRKK